jgi:hypothetical protein
MFGNVPVNSSLTSVREVVSGTLPNSYSVVSTQQPGSAVDFWKNRHERISGNPVATTLAMKSVLDLGRRLAKTDSDI